MRNNFQHLMAKKCGNDAQAAASPSASGSHYTPCQSKALNTNQFALYENLFINSTNRYAELECCCWPSAPTLSLFVANAAAVPVVGVTCCQQAKWQTTTSQATGSNTENKSNQKNLINLPISANVAFSCCQLLLLQPHVAAICTSMFWHMLIAVYANQ